MLVVISNKIQVLERCLYITNFYMTLCMKLEGSHIFAPHADDYAKVHKIY